MWARAWWAGMGAWLCCVAAVHAQTQDLKPPRVLGAGALQLPKAYLSNEPQQVKVRLLISEHGIVDRAEVMESSDSALDWAALGTACGLAFEPAQMAGAPVAIYVDWVFRVDPVMLAPQSAPASASGPAPEANAPPTEDQTAPSASLPAVEAPRMASVVGRVSAAESGEPLADVEVFVPLADGDGVGGETDAHGRFELTDVPAGERVVSFVARGWQQVAVRVDLGPGEVVDLHVTLMPRRRRVTFETLVQAALARRVSGHLGMISTVVEKDLRMQAPHSGNDVIRNITGVHVRDEEGMGLRLNVGIRGLDPSRSRKTLLLEDGLPIALNPYNEPDAYYTPPIERMRGLTVEKGVGSLRNGPQTVGGVLNYLTADPPPRLTVHGEIRGGSYGYFMSHMAAGDTRGPVGWRFDLTHRSFPGPRHLELQMLDAALKLVLTPQDGTRVAFKLNLYDEFSRSTYLGLTTPQYKHNWQDNFAIHDRFTVRRYATSIQLDHQVFKGMVLRAGAYGYRVERNWGRQNFDRFPRDLPYERRVPGTPGAPARSDGSSIFFHDDVIFRDRAYNVAGAQVEGEWHLGRGPLQVLVTTGARAHAEQAHERRLKGGSATAVDGATIQEEDRMGLAAATWTVARFTLFERLHLLPAVRLEGISGSRHVTRTLVPDRLGDLKAQDVNQLSRTQQVAVLPGVGAALDVWDGLVLFVGLHRGWAPPRIKDSLVANGQNIQVAAERSWNLEAGARLAVGSFLAAEGALFIMDFQNEIIVPSEAGGAAVLIDNATGVPKAYSAPAQHRGVESSISMDWGRLASLPLGLTTSAGYTFVDARFTGGAFKGMVVPYAPAHLFNYRARFEHPTTGISGQLNGNWVGSQYADNSNTEEASVDGATGRMDPYLVVDATGAWRFAALELFASIKNVADQRYIVSRAPRGIMPGNPRQFMVGLRVDM